MRTLRPILIRKNWHGALLSPTGAVLAVTLFRSTSRDAAMRAAVALLRGAL